MPSGLVVVAPNCDSIREIRVRYKKSYLEWERGNEPGRERSPGEDSPGKDEVYDEARRTKESRTKKREAHRRCASRFTGRFPHRGGPTESNWRSSGFLQSQDSCIKVDRCTVHTSRPKTSMIES